MSDTTRPDELGASQLSAPIDKDVTEIPVLSITPYKLDADKRIGESGEFIRCTGMTIDPWPKLTGCRRGLRPEDGGVAPRSWDAGTYVYEVPWSGVVDILDYIPIPTLGMVGRPFAYRDAAGNIFTFNVIVLQDGTLAIDWVNEPPAIPGEDDFTFEAVARINEPNPIGVYPEATGDIYAIADGHYIFRFNALFVMQYGNTFGGATSDTFNHVYSDGTRVFWTDGISFDSRYKLLVIPAVAGTPANIWDDYINGIMPGHLSFPRGIIGDGTNNIWVVDSARNRVHKMDMPNVGSWSGLQIIGNSPTWIPFNRMNLTGGPGFAVTGPDQIFYDAKARRLLLADSSGYIIDSAGSAYSTSGLQPISGVAKALNTTDMFAVLFSPATPRNDTVRRLSNVGDPIWTVGLSNGFGNWIGRHIAVSDDGATLWITVNDVIQKRAGSTGALQSTYGGTGSTDGLFNTPRGISYNDQYGSPRLYIADEGNNRVQQLNPATGAFVAKITGYGVGNATAFGSVNGVDQDLHGNVYIMDAVNNLVHHYTKAHVWLVSVPFSVDNSARSMAVAEDGELWATEFAVPKIQANRPDWPGSTAAGMFDHPMAITIGPTSTHLYVLDSGNGRVQKFLKSTGAWVATFTFGVGNAEGQISDLAEGIAIDADGNIWIADTFNHRINVYDATGVFLFKFGSFGSGQDQFNTPCQISFNATRTVLWIADSGNDRLVTLRKIDSAALALGYNAYDWDEEFIGGGTTSGAIGERGWTFSGNGTIAVQPSTAANPGLVRLSTGGASGNKNRITLGPWILPQMDKMTFIGFFASNGTATAVHQRMGIGGGVNHLDTLLASDGVCVEYQDAVSTGFLSIVKFVGGVRTGIITTVPFLAQAPYLFEIEVTAPGEVTATLTQLLALGGGAKATVVLTGISQTAQFDAAFAQRTTNGTAKVMDPDYWSGSFSGLGRA